MNATATKLPSAKAILDEIKPLGRDSYKKILMNHGVTESSYGVKIEDLKKIQKRVKMDYRLALELYDTGVYDAMYLAGLIADDARMTKKDLRHWLATATHTPLVSWTVATVTAGSPHGWELALEWIDSGKTAAAEAGWSALSRIIAVKADTELDLAAVKRLLLRAEKEIHQAPDDVRYQMNGFVISVGGYIKSLTKVALEVAERIGKVSVDMGGTACKVPFASEYIRKMEKRGNIGKKRKSAKC